MATDDQYKASIKAVNSGVFSDTDLKRVERMADQASPGLFSLVGKAKEAKATNDARPK